ncbi:MAG: serine hydrolase domain-containing protein [Actinomycetes bacterium]
MFDADAYSAYLGKRADDGLFSGVVRIDVDGPGGEHRTLLEQGYGLASRAWNIPCAPHIRFDTASTTKLFTAVAALQQVDAGAFALDTSVTEYLGLTGTQISDLVTPYHLLTHTSGIADDADEEAGERYEDLFVDEPNYSTRVTSDHLPHFINKPPNFAPGAGTRYCNVSYVLVGLMIEKATGLSYREYVQRRVFEPAGMTRAVFAASDVVTPDIAEGADPITDDSGQVVGWKRNIFSYPPIGSPDGGAHVTAADLIAFHRALRDRTLLSPTLTQAMLTPHETYRPRGAGTHFTGFGFEFSSDATSAINCYWKEGMNAGVSAVLSHYPSLSEAVLPGPGELTLVVLSNMEDGAWEPIREFGRSVGVSAGGTDSIE